MPVKRYITFIEFIHCLRMQQAQILYLKVKMFEQTVQDKKCSIK